MPKFDPDYIPICRVCGEPIKQGNDRKYVWQSRTLCRPVDDEKADGFKCFQVHASRRAKKVDAVKKPPKGCKPKDIFHKPKVLVEPSPKETRLDREQIRLNLEIDREIAKRHGYGHGEVRVLTREEIDALYPSLQPPEKPAGFVDRLVPHFKSSHRRRD